MFLFFKKSYMQHSFQAKPCAHSHNIRTLHAAHASAKAKVKGKADGNGKAALKSTSIQLKALLTMAKETKELPTSLVPTAIKSA